MLKRRNQKGFTLIELLIVVAIIGIIAALLIPNFLEALQKAKQKRTMADERNWGNAAMQWVTDTLGAAAAGQGTYDITNWEGGADTYSAVRQVLVVDADYITEMPEKDGWRHNYDYRLKTNKPLDPQVMLVRSPGRDGSPTGNATGPYDPTLYAQDIVWADGFFLRWPERTSAAQTN
jgi:general secretion pathway protein G